MFLSIIQCYSIDFLSFFFFSLSFFLSFSLSPVLSLQVWLIVPILFAGVQIFLLTVPLIMSPMEVVGAVGIILIGLPVYYFAVYRQDLARLFSGVLGKDGEMRVSYGMMSYVILFLSLLFFFFIYLDFFLELCVCFIIFFYFSSD